MNIGKFKSAMDGCTKYILYDDKYKSGALNNIDSLFNPTRKLMFKINQFYPASSIKFITTFEDYKIENAENFI